MILPGTPEYQDWINARLGKATASRIGDVIAKAKNGTYRATRNNYKGELVSERRTGLPYKKYQSESMRWGTEHQQDAENCYSFYTGRAVEPINFVPHPHIAMSGSSPDGLVGKQGLIEVKCPDTDTHIETLLGAEIDIGYLAQVQWQMRCTGRTWCDWCSFDPRMPEDERLEIRRVYYDSNAILLLENEVISFLNEVDATMKALDQRRQARAA